ncbi:uncharacterized protein LOC120531060 isoform X2 [Polypterus senegalus]|uniref:uncharacterized protein LOC120531060 isoform X2 n=1 Tax=Polypterus senegalus TaxID=55291 RepID=UPI0019663099|nr:uncharacterized protein LOC120531060 isoform X2 [Polypterus senegalus]
MNDHQAEKMVLKNPKKPPLKRLMVQSNVAIPHDCISGPEGLLSFSDNCGYMKQCNLHHSHSMQKASQKDVLSGRLSNNVLRHRSFKYPSYTTHECTNSRTSCQKASENCRFCTGYSEGSEEDLLPFHYSKDSALQASASVKVDVQMETDLVNCKVLDSPQELSMTDVVEQGSCDSRQMESRKNGNSLNAFPLDPSTYETCASVQSGSSSNLHHSLINSSNACHNLPQGYRKCQPSSTCENQRSHLSKTVLTDESHSHESSTVDFLHSETMTTSMSCCVVHQCAVGHTFSGRPSSSWGRESSVPEPLEFPNRPIRMAQSSKAYSFGKQDLQTPGSTVAVSVVASIAHEGQRRFLPSPKKIRGCFEGQLDQVNASLECMLTPELDANDLNMHLQGRFCSFQGSLKSAVLKSPSDSSHVGSHLHTASYTDGNLLHKNEQKVNSASLYVDLKRSSSVGKFNLTPFSSRRYGLSLKKNSYQNGNMNDPVCFKTEGDGQKRQGHLPLRETRLDRYRHHISVSSSISFQTNDRMDEKRHGREKIVQKGPHSESHNSLQSFPNLVMMPLNYSTESTKERFLKPYRQQLLYRYFNAWKDYVILRDAAARFVNESHLLRKGLAALQCAVQIRHMQMSSVAARNRKRILTAYFKLWKFAFAECQQHGDYPFQCLSNQDCHVRELSRSTNNQLFINPTTTEQVNCNVSTTCMKMAEAHHSVTLLSKHWIVWRKAMIKNSQRNQQEILALVYEGYNLKRMAFLTWMEHFYKKWLATRHHRRALLSCVFKVWCTQVRDAQVVRQIQLQQSITFYRNVLIRRSFQLWSQTLTVKKTLEKHRCRIARKFIIRWIQAVCRKKLKKMQLMATQHLKRKRLENALRIWQLVKEKKGAEKAQMKECWRLLERNKMKVAFRVWRECYCERQRLQPLISIIRKRRLSSCFQSWREVVLQKYIAFRHCIQLQRLTVKTCFIHWRWLLKLQYLQKVFILRTAGRREQQTTNCSRGFPQELLNRSVKTLHDHLLLQKAFRKWKEQCQKQLGPSFLFPEDNQCRVQAVLTRWHTLTKEALEGRAVRSITKLSRTTTTLSLLDVSTMSLGFYSTSPNRVPSKITPGFKEKTVSDQTLQPCDPVVLAGLDKMCNDLKRKLEIRKLHWCFFHWFAEMYNFQNVTFHHQRTLMSRMLANWRTQTKMRITRRKLLGLFQCQSQLKLLTSYFKEWCTKLMRSQRRQCTLQLSILKLHHFQQATFFHRWRMATRGRQTHKKYCQLIITQAFCWWKKVAISSKKVWHIVQQRRIASLRLYFIYWHIKFKESKDLQMKTKVFCISRNKHRVSQAFSVWVTCYLSQCNADKLYQRHLLRRVFLQWQNFICNLKQRLAYGNKIITALQVRTIFSMWRKQADIVPKRRLLTLKITQTQQVNLLRSILTSWSQLVLSKRHRVQYLSRKYFTRWALVALGPQQEDMTENLQNRSQRKFRTYLSKKYFMRWRHESLLQQYQKRKVVQITIMAWNQWKEVTEAELFIKNINERQKLDKAWMEWRKRFIQIQVVQNFMAKQQKALLFEAFSAWCSLVYPQKVKEKPLGYVHTSMQGYTREGETEQVNILQQQKKSKGAEDSAFVTLSHVAS